MPAVNLRLTDEQHAALVREAATNGRSLQREIVHRCFRAAVEPRVTARPVARLDVDAEDRSVKARILAAASTGSEVKTDFKK